MSKPINVSGVQSGSICCQGYEAPYDHPLIYLAIDLELGHVDCPYCGRNFTLQTADKS